jgi:putative ABC transport system permease protein
MKRLLKVEKIKEPALIKQTAFEVHSKKKTLDSYLIVPENEKLFAKYYNLKSQINAKNIILNDKGVVITQKIAETFNKVPGDQIVIKNLDGPSYSLTIAAVAENYLQNYIYMNKVMYKKVFRTAPSYNMIVADGGQDETTAAKHLLQNLSVANVNFQSDILKKSVDGQKSLDNIIILLVVIASLLVVIVLYNLTSINISERKREIATLKVLGFTDQESNQYIYREAFTLTLISTGVGLGLGIMLHRFIISVIESDTTVYFKNIHGGSFLWVALIIITVATIMQMVTYLNIRTIEMVESLKSVE